MWNCVYETNSKQNINDGKATHSQSVYRREKYYSAHTQSYLCILNEKPLRMRRVWFLVFLVQLEHFVHTPDQNEKIKFVWAEQNPNTKFNLCIWRKYLSAHKRTHKYKLNWNWTAHYSKRVCFALRLRRDEQKMYDVLCFALPFLA